MKQRTVLLLLILAALAVHAQKPPKFWPVTIGDVTYDQIELALTPAQRTRGLMNRTHLPRNGGMLFVFPKAALLSFWMKNTLIPLDILFLDADGTVVAIHTMPAERPRHPAENERLYDMRLPLYPSRKPAQFAIELHAGQCRVNRAKPGDRIDIRPAELIRLLTGN